MQFFTSKKQPIVVKDEDVSVFQEVMPEVVTRAPRVSRIDTKNVFKPPWWFIEGNATVVVQNKYFSVPGIGLVLENGADVDEEPLQAPLYPAWEKDLPMEKHNVKTAERRGLMYLEYIGSPVLICKVIRVSTDTLTVQVRGTDLKGAMNYYFKCSTDQLHKRLATYYGSKDVWEMDLKTLTGGSRVERPFSSHVQARVTLLLRNYYKDVKVEKY